ncbi:MAG: hypothetical protein K2L61_02655 [Clostridia bacterium]|nr:hypothetical protein [Clostridia bacterium]MDE6372423.1 hypothetical protein [Clostridia bacterium]MDE6605370.1 hypothetical protein [Clostridia bacterium]MDE6869847.1 hypothetical protein [Clostridia bacterium]
MATITNLSNVTDYSGETPITTYSNPVTTIVNQPNQPPFVPRMAPCPPCNCSCNCNCQWQCNGCGN